MGVEGDRGHLGNWVDNVSQFVHTIGIIFLLESKLSISKINYYW